MSRDPSKSFHDGAIPLVVQQQERRPDLVGVEGRRVAHVGVHVLQEVYLLFESQLLAVNSQYLYVIRAIHAPLFPPGGILQQVEIIGCFHDMLNHFRLQHLSCLVFLN